MNKSDVRVGEGSQFNVGGGFYGAADKINHLAELPIHQTVRLQSDPASVGSPEPSRQVFIVHGHDEALKQDVAQLVTKLGLEPMILADRPHRGQKIIEKFDSHSNVLFAVVLLTPDDIGATRAQYEADPTEVSGRARQNVILELGYFFGKLGRSNVCALFREDLELPTDILGVRYIPVDSTQGWRLQLAGELKTAGERVGVKIDINLLW